MLRYRDIYKKMYADTSYNTLSREIPRSAKTTKSLAHGSLRTRQRDLHGKDAGYTTVPEEITSPKALADHHGISQVSGNSTAAATIGMQVQGTSTHNTSVGRTRSAATFKGGVVEASFNRSSHMQ